MKILVHMIRHGLTEGNISEWIYGGADIPLIEKGREKIRKLAEEGIYPEPDTDFYFTSGMKRTEETFEIIYGEKGHRQITALQEMKFGIYERMPVKEALKDEEFIKFAEDRSGDISLEDGESENHFRARLTSGMANVLEIIEEEAYDSINKRNENGELEAVVVCHGGVISTLLTEKFKKDDVEHIYGYVPSPGRGYTFIYEDGELVDYRPI